MKRLAMAMFACALALPGFGEVLMKQVPYMIDGAEFEGVVAYDTDAKGKRPGVLIVHEWWGLNDYVKGRAKQLAELGYVAFAADVYGKGKVTTDPKQAGDWAMALRGSNRTDLRKRAMTGLDVLKKMEQVDAANTAAIGYCFGGSTVLELARAGADVKGVVCFHGGLAPGATTSTETIKAKVLVLHGADDPHVPQEEVTKFMEEMNAAKADWYLTAYAYAVHAFTNPKSGNDPSKGNAYNENADKRSWRAMLDFFGELFEKGNMQ